MDAIYLLQLLLNGLVIGVIYALIAMGLSLIFGLLGIVNFAHGEFYMLGAMLSFFAVTDLHFGYWTTILAVTLVACAVGLLFYHLFLASLRPADFERSILLTLGISMVLQNGGIFLWTVTPRMVPTPWSYTAVTLGDLQLPLLRLFTLGIATAAFLALYVLLSHTLVGKAMRGLSQSRDAAAMVGIDHRRVARLAVIIGIGLSGLAGATLAPVYSVQPTMGAAFVFKAFAIVIIGGLGNIMGAAIAAVMLGVLESLIGGFFPLTLADSAGFIAMILVLLFKPEGLFGRGVRV
ncbi:MAG: branched-chain amino acid ABC transporter permease [Acetobacteraceae bacterium]|jgi:branched-chain amino acid transport system permease protein